MCVCAKLHYLKKRPTNGTLIGNNLSFLFYKVENHKNLTLRKEEKIRTHILSI